jgi:YfiH family protein
MNEIPSDWIVPSWPAPRRVRALITTRAGGVSTGVYDTPDRAGGLNLGLGAADVPSAVEENRSRLTRHLPAAPRWLRQVHGAGVVEADRVDAPFDADAAFTATPGVVAAVMIADCMPVLFAERSGRCVGIAHAGWRGLAAGVFQATVRAMRVKLGDPAAEFVAYLGPAIGPRHFEVGGEVLEAFGRTLPHAGDAFVADGGKHRADLFKLARQALAAVGVGAVYGGGDCTYSDPTRFYSHRRDGATGRHGALIWLAPEEHPAAYGMRDGSV